MNNTAQSPEEQARLRNNGNTLGAVLAVIGVMALLARLGAR
jgi:hypothetical protein